jgi:3'-phosphoadenosine 5'-phosphosulfate sulfotransferase (PAPS reductase)/FAD synthetase
MAGRKTPENEGKAIHFIFGNYGDNTIALIRWAYLNQLTDITVIHINTGWGSSRWQQRVSQGIRLVQDYGFTSQELSPSHNLSDLVRDRQSFPNAKYQWCTTFLKALPVISFLDEVDEFCQSVVLLGARRRDSRARANLPEFITESEHYGDRKVWFPLYDTSQKERDDLILATGFEVLNSPGQECFPCIHSSISELKALQPKQIKIVRALEQEITQTMFAARYPEMSIEQLRDMSLPPEEESANKMEQFDMGCGSHYVCGE